MLARHQSEVGHELPGAGEAVQVANLGHDGGSAEKVDAAQSHQRLDYRPEHRLACNPRQLVVDCLNAPAAGVDGLDVLLEDDLLDRAVELDGIEPAEINLGQFAVAREARALAQQKGGQPLARLALQVLHVFAGTGEIAQRFLRLVRHPYCRRLSSTMQARQRQRVAPVGLHPVTGLFRNQRGRHDLTVFPRPG